MRAFGKWLGRTLLALAVLLGLAWLLLPREPAPLDFTFDPAAFGDDLDAYFAAAEAGVDGITPGVEKQVVWAGAPGARTGLALVYIHGFSATSAEMSPVPRRLAERFGANLVLTRLTGHGRDGAAMAEARVADWTRDTAEAIRAARHVGDRVVVLSLSTGGTLAAAAAHVPALMQDVAGIVFVSPNFGVNNAAAPLLTWPGARFWLPKLTGETRSWKPANDAQARYWTNSYPTEALLPMAALVAAVTERDYSGTNTPALFYFSPDDRVVRAVVTARIAAEWGRAGPAGTAEIIQPALTPRDDPNAHNIVGDILSPGQTAFALDAIGSWISGLE